MGREQVGLVQKLKKACESAVLPPEFVREGYGPKLPMGLYRLSREEAIVVHAGADGLFLSVCVGSRWALFICNH